MSDCPPQGEEINEPEQDGVAVPIGLEMCSVYFKNADLCIFRFMRTWIAGAAPDAGAGIRREPITCDEGLHIRSETFTIQESSNKC